MTCICFQYFHCIFCFSSDTKISHDNSHNLYFICFTIHSQWQTFRFCWFLRDLHTLFQGANTGLVSHLLLTNISPWITAHKPIVTCKYSLPLMIIGWLTSLYWVIIHWWLLSSVSGCADVSKGIETTWQEYVNKLPFIWKTFWSDEGKFTSIN